MLPVYHKLSALNKIGTIKISSDSGSERDGWGDGGGSVDASDSRDDGTLFVVAFDGVGDGGSNRSPEY